MKVIIILLACYSSIGCIYGQNKFEKLVLAEAKELGLPYETIKDYFSGISPCDEYPSINPDQNKLLQKISLAYPGSAWLFYNENEDKRSNQMVLIIHRTPLNSFNARLVRQGFVRVKDIYKPWEVSTYEKGNLMVQVFFYKVVVGDIFLHFADCIEKDATSIERIFVVVIFHTI